ncbi:MAG: hypothetical protein H6736_17105 [Alphaproteobacteria bacterium]|nr:hypothetical protein [Alphaproteobacteria bacterium]
MEKWVDSAQVFQLALAYISAGHFGNLQDALGHAVSELATLDTERLRDPAGRDFRVHGAILGDSPGMRRVIFED